MRGSRHDQRILLLSLGASLPGVALASFLVWTGGLGLGPALALNAGLLAAWVGCTVALDRTERRARERRVRILAHEVNNSLAPIRSIAAGLERILEGPLPDDWREEVARGLAVIRRRSDGLGRFVTSWAQLARLPQPRPTAFGVRTWVEHAAGLETRVEVAVESGSDVELRADRDQLDQVLINLLRNAADAALETGGGVRLGWTNGSRKLDIWVEDDGPGLPEAGDPFDPFFTTKSDGTGIGLALSRRIVEGHGGRLRLANRAAGRGCRAVLSLPLDGPGRS